MIHVGFKYVYVNAPIKTGLVLSCNGQQKLTFFN